MPSVLEPPADRVAVSPANAPAVAEQLAALCDLLDRIETTECREEAAATLSESLAGYLSVDHVYVALADAEGRLKVVSASHRDQLDVADQQAVAAGALMSEAVLRGRVSLWPSVNVADSDTLLCHKQYAESNGLVGVIGVPLRDRTGDLQGAMLIAFRDESPRFFGAATFLRTSQTSIATAIRLIHRAEQNRFRRQLSALMRRLRGNRLRVIQLGLVLALGVLCVPIPYTVKAKCTIEPSACRYVSAPFGAKLLDCPVELGEIVQAGQLLARLDAEETEWELASVEAELQRAKKERAGHVATHESGQARLAQHEIEYLNAKARLLENRVAQQEVRSPFAGVVVSGDLSKQEGTMLEVGQTLFEVAPLDELVAEIAVPEADVRFLPENAPVKMKLDALPFQAYQSTIEQLHPRAEIHDDKNVFVARADIPDAQRSQQLRPGMQGHAWIKTAPRPIGWIWLHKPVGALLNWLGI